MSTAPDWSEVFEGGSPAAEEIIFRTRVAELRLLQAARDGIPAALRPNRLMYTKTIAGVNNAQLVVDHLMPAEFVVGHFQPGARLPATVRFSNASGIAQSDSAPDMRGIAVRIALPSGDEHDLLMANFPSTFVRNAWQLMEFAKAWIDQREALLARLASRLGEDEARRIARGLKAALRLCASLAQERYWGAAAFLWGANPVRYELRPAGASLSADTVVDRGADALRCDLATRLARGSLRFRLAVQRYVDERQTPIEDASVDWPQAASPCVEIATMVIPQQDLLTAEALRALARIEDLRFDIWNAPPPFRPLGSLNRFRRLLYPMSAYARTQELIDDEP